jgi:hypothetical protein
MTGGKNSGIIGLRNWQQHDYYNGVDLHPSNPEERAALLEEKKSQIQKEINELKAGIVTELKPAEQRERIREIYQLASVLTGDFRRVEDEIRLLDQELRIQIIEGDATRGDVLLSVMKKEALLEETDAGSAFEGFFQLLCDQNRSMEFRDQLRSILNTPVADHLSHSQRQFLAQLMRELTYESDRVSSSNFIICMGIKAASIEQKTLKSNKQTLFCFLDFILFLQMKHII